MDGDERSTTVSWPAIRSRTEVLLHDAWELVTEQDALDTTVELTNIWSYSGHEGELAHHLANRLARAGLDARVQAIDERAANAIVSLGQAGSDGPTVGLAAPVDTHFAGDERDGVMWGIPPRRDARLPAEVVGRSVLGLGSDNPKALCAAMTLALEALSRVGFAPRGQLVAAFFGCGAPARAATDEPRQFVGLGAGAYHALSHGFLPDFLLYHKPGYQVSWEDHSLNQFEIVVSGDPTYMALGGDYRVVDAIARITDGFNRWARENYAKRRAGTFDCFAALNAIEVGRLDKPNWSGAVARLGADIRTAPRADLAYGQRVMDEAMDRIRPMVSGLELSWRQVAYMPGGSTDPSSWIVQSAIRGALSVDGRRDEIYHSASAGQTEMGLFQRLGVPCAKLHGVPEGQALHPELPADIREFTLSAAWAPHIVKAARVMIYVALDLLTRSRDEVGLPA